MFSFATISTKLSHFLTWRICSRSIFMDAGNRLFMLSLPSTKTSSRYGRVRLPYGSSFQTCSEISFSRGMGRGSEAGLILFIFVWLNTALTELQSRTCSSSKLLREGSKWEGIVAFVKNPHTSMINDFRLQRNESVTGIDRSHIFWYRRESPITKWSCLTCKSEDMKLLDTMQACILFSFIR